MPGMTTSFHMTNVLELTGFLVVWFVLLEGVRILVALLRSGPLIGWAVSPLGVTFMFLREPSMSSIWVNVLLPAAASGGIIYVGLFTAIAPFSLPHNPLFEAIVILCGVLFSSTRDFARAMHDLRYPLWGEARVLQSIQHLRVRYASIHFTAFGLSYLHDQFGSSPTDLLQVM